MLNHWFATARPPLTRLTAGRAAHSVSLVGSTLYLLCGYAGLRPGSAKYIGDCWALDLPLRSPRGAPQVQAALDVGSAVPFTTKPSTKAQQQQPQQQVCGAGCKGGARGRRRVGAWQWVGSKTRACSGDVLVQEEDSGQTCAARRSPLRVAVTATTAMPPHRHHLNTRIRHVQPCSG